MALKRKATKAKAQPKVTATKQEKLEAVSLQVQQARQKLLELKALRKEILNST